MTFDLLAQYKRELELVSKTIEELVSSVEDAVTYHNRAFTHKRLEDLQRHRERLLNDIADLEGGDAGGDLPMATGTFVSESDL